MNRSAMLALLGGATTSLALPAAAQTVGVPLRLGAMAIDAFGEAYYGSDQGFYQANGIAPQITTLGNGATLLAAMIGGDLDVTMTNTVAAAAAFARGVPLQMIAPASLYSTRDAADDLMVAKDGPVKTAKDLIGGTIAVSALGDFSTLGTEAWLEHNGVKPEQVHFVELKFTEMGAALQRGTVQAAQIAEPAKSAAIAAGQIRPFADVYLAVAPEFATIVWIATKAWLAANADTAKKLVAAIYATARWANTHTDASADILARVSKIDRSIIAKTQRLYFGTSNQRHYIAPVLTLAARYGIIQRPVSPDEFSAFPLIGS